MTDSKKTDSESTTPIGPRVSMVDAVSPYPPPKAGWVLAPQARRRPPSFTAPPAQGRSRLLQDGNFVGLPHFADKYDNELLLPPGVAEQFKALKVRLAKEEGVREGQLDSDAERDEIEQQERVRRAAQRQKLEAEKAEREAQEAQEKLAASLKRMGFDPDQKGFKDQVEKLPPTQRLRVYREEDVQRMASSAQSVDSDVKKRNESLGYLLKARGLWRRLGAPESVEAILALQADHPHFGEVVQFVANHVALQKMRTQPHGPAGSEEIKSPVRLPPLLLFGPPGVGKTHFCESLAKVLGVPVRRHPMDQAETSSALLGSDVTWSNSRYGLVFDLLGPGDYANPLVILDELDKAQVMGKTSGGLSSPTGVLHSLLEPVSAANVRDISLDLELDASQISWIATANYPWWVPATLRSRFKEFLIEPPDAEQAIQLSRSVVRNALKAAGFGAGEPDKRIVVALAHLSAREIYQVTLAAAAKAAVTGQRVLGVEHLPMELRNDCDALGGERRALLH